MSQRKTLSQSISVEEQERIFQLSKEVCEEIAKLANLKITFNGSKSPGRQLHNFLNRSGCTSNELREYLSLVNTLTCYKPETKVALLIANQEYENLSDLVTPSKDCESLGIRLRELGFLTVSIKNTKSCTLKDILIKTIALIPENSYCFLIYAGHGCELINTKCILSTDCPTENIEFDHCVTENWLLRESAKCKPELCVLIMDMCRINLDRQSNPQIYTTINIEEYTIHSNLLITYSTQSSSAAYECVWIETEETIGTASYSIKVDDVVCGGASQYVNALCCRLDENIGDVSTILDKVHADMEDLKKPQRPIKVQCGVSKRFLNDPVKGDPKELVFILRKALEPYNEYCTVSMYQKTE